MFHDFYKKSGWGGYLHDKITDDEGDECMSTFAVEAFSALKEDRASLLCFFYRGNQLLFVPLYERSREIFMSLCPWVG